MTTVSINFVGEPDKNPYLPSDNVNGSNFTSRRSNAKTLSSAWFGQADSVWSCDVDPAVNTFTMQTVFDTVDSNARGLVAHVTGGNGFLFIANNANVRVFAMEAWALSGSPITYTTTFATGGTLNIDVTQSTGTYVVKNGSTVIGTFINTTYTSGLKSGLTSRTNGRIRSFALTYTPAQSIDTITNPLIPDGAFTGNQTGFANGAVTVTTPVIGGGTVSSSATVSGSTYSGTYATPISGAAYPLFGSTQSHTFTHGALTASISSVIGNPAGFSRVTLSSPVTDDDTYITGNLSPTPVTGDLLLYKTADFISFSSDGADEVADEITTQIIHQVASTGVVYIWEMTINEITGVVSSRALNSIGLASTGLTFFGLSSVGL